VHGLPVLVVYGGIVAKVLVVMGAVFLGWRISTEMGHRPGIQSWSPFELVLVAATHCDLTRLSGNVDLAARWQDIVNHHARVLSDPDRGLALALWQT
jgi:hypothetical protein